MRLLINITVLLLTGWVCIWGPGPAWAGAPGRTEPPKFYISKNVCPFECCTYGTWRAVKDVDLLDQPNGKKVGAVKEGEPIEAITGEVHSTPGILTVAMDHGRFKKGDTIYILHYVGEGYFKYWYKGKIDEHEFIFLVNPAEDDPECKTPREDCWAQTLRREHSTWWVKMKTKRGTVGWTGHPELFGEKDSCG